ncbi:hypothetical protein ACH5RR_027799 [Cinchona calisaya]|uniref:Uncharacterized protein n=1 Tax=Cinchona calisaya TaxID=153742 RepID=A0ABD2YS84_9GENT
MDNLDKGTAELSIHWEKTFHLYETVIVGDDKSLRIQATFKLGCMSKHGPETILACAITVVVEFLRALMELIQNGDISAKLVAANALGISSSHVDYIRPAAQAGAIPLFAEILGGCEPLGKEIAEDVFCVVAVAEENAVVIFQHLV